jgi:hypothetical protein
LTLFVFMRAVVALAGSVVLCMLVVRTHRQQAEVLYTAAHAEVAPFQRVGHAPHAVTLLTRMLELSWRTLLLDKGMMMRSSI